jgi:ADP-heptose:LPS heptosyltransferase
MFKRFLRELLLAPFKILLRVKSSSRADLGSPKTFLVIWTNSSFGFFLSGKTLFRHLKEKYPNSKLILLTDGRFVGLLENEDIYKSLGFTGDDKIISLKNFHAIFSTKFDVAIVPTIDKFSPLTHILMRLSKSKIRIGISSIDDKENPYSFLFDRQIELNWNSVRDTHISEFLLELLKQFGIYQQFRISKLNVFRDPVSERKEICRKAGIRNNQKIVIINNEPEEIQNRWGIENLVKLINLFVKSGDYYFYYIEDKIEQDFKVMLETDEKVFHYVNKNNLNDLLKIFSISDLLITCDSALMHFAGLTDISQISIFGINNPFNWAPLGANKKFIKKSDLINDVTAEDVFQLSQELLNMADNNE